MTQLKPERGPKETDAKQRCVLVKVILWCIKLTFTLACTRVRSELRHFAEMLPSFRLSLVVHTYVLL